MTRLPNFVSKFIFIFFICMNFSACIHPIKSNEPYIVGAMGDSITVGPIFSGISFSNWSWVTSKKKKFSSISSLVEQCSGFEGQQYFGFNVAKFGARSDEFKEQIEDLSLQVASDVNYDLITITIGHNDICRYGINTKRHLAEIKTNISQVIQKLLKRNPGVKIVLIPLINLAELKREEDAAGCSKRFLAFQSCRVMRTISDNGLHKIEAIVAHINDGLKEIAKKFSDNIFYIHSIENVMLRSNFIQKFDCFHPNREGYSMIAKETWKVMKPHVCSSLAQPKQP